MGQQVMWMVRAASGGRLADEFQEQGVVAIGWGDIGDLNQYKDKAAMLEAIRNAWPEWASGKCMSSASQLIRFREELNDGDRVITYDSSRRIYHVGTISGMYKYQPSVLPPLENTMTIWIWKGETCCH